MRYNCLSENPSQERVLADINNVPEKIERGIIVLSLMSYNLFNSRREGRAIATYHLKGDEKDSTGIELELIIKSKNSEEKPAGLVFKIDKQFDWKSLKGVVNEKIREGYGIYGYEFLWKDEGFHLLRYNAIALRGKKSLEEWMV
jgi:hypothetical protein